MKNTGNIALIVCSFIISFLLIDKFNSHQTHKIGVVQMSKLVYEFKGMKEATEKYSQQMNEWSRESDSLEKSLKNAYEQIQIDSTKNNKTRLKDDIERFARLRNVYFTRKESIKEDAQERDREMTLGVISQVNECLKTFAAKNGYDLVLCNTEQQTVGYQKEMMDITNAVLEFANRHYEGLTN